MTIKVKGETYRDAGELAETIERLGAEYAGMSDGPEKLSMGAHIDELYSVLGGYANGEGGTGGNAGNDLEVSRSPALPPTTDDDDDDEHDALAEGASFSCPMCEGTGELPNEPPPDPLSDRCVTCSGWGKVYTGSLVEGHAIRECPTCQGQGWTEKAHSFALPPAPMRTAAESPEAPGAWWAEDTKDWNPPVGVQPPWVGATWDRFYGKWA